LATSAPVGVTEYTASGGPQSLEPSGRSDAHSDPPFTHTATARPLGALEMRACDEAVSCPASRRRGWRGDPAARNDTNTWLTPASRFR
jgi:hypothetical protein